MKGKSVINITKKSSDRCRNFVGQCFCPRSYFVLTVGRLYGNTSENMMRPIERLINRFCFKRHQLSMGLWFCDRLEQLTTQSSGFAGELIPLGEKND